MGIAAALLAGWTATVQAPARGETVRVPGVDVSFEMVFVPGGRHRVAATAREADLPPFWIGKYEATWGEFNAFYESPEREKADGITRPSRGRDFLGSAASPPTSWGASAP